MWSWHVHRRQHWQTVTTAVISQLLTTVDGASSSQRSISTKFCLIITGCGLCSGAKTAIYSCSVSVCGGCVDDIHGVVIIRFIWWMHTNHYSTKPTNLALGPHHYRCLLLLLAGHYICVCVCVTACQCYGHSTECEYNAEVAANKSSVDIHGEMIGGGVCQDCRHNTAGINCEQCRDGFYRPFNVPLDSPHVCRSTYHDIIHCYLDPGDTSSDLLVEATSAGRTTQLRSGAETIYTNWWRIDNTFSIKGS